MASDLRISTNFRRMAKRSSAERARNLLSLPKYIVVPSKYFLKNDSNSLDNSCRSITKFPITTPHITIQGFSLLRQKTKGKFCIGKSLFGSLADSTQLR